jgi:tetratricopeptide (TPR) repeat protein
VVQDQPLFPGAFLSLAELHRRAGQLDEARKNAEAAEKLSPNGWEARLALARIATAGGRGADALRLRDETLLLAGENEPARKRIRKTWNKK